MVGKTTKMMWIRKKHKKVNDKREKKQIWRKKTAA